jgi:biotin carboxyl carrier protein
MSAEKTITTSISAAKRTTAPISAAKKRTAPVSAAKVVSLNVVASQVSTLCFEVGGILVESDTTLGAKVAAFDFAAFYGILGSMPTIPGDSGRLFYDFLEIQAFVKPFTLAAVRAEPNKAALSKAVNARANAFYAKYANAPAIIARMNEFYSPSIAESKPNRLDILSFFSLNQMQQLRDAYLSEGRTGVVKTTRSDLDSTLQSGGTSDTTDQTIQKSAQFSTTGANFPPPPPGTPGTIGSPDNPVGEDFQEGSGSQHTTSTGSATEHQTIVNTDYGYRIPFIENAAQYERAQISLIDQKFAAFMYAQNLPNLAAVFQNELTSIDSDVYRTQIAYLNTILMSPIPGTVTGIYKNPGDCVRPGEPVIRVENNDVVYLVATLVYRGPIVVGSSVTVATTLFDLSGPPTTVTGNVVAVRGRHEDEHWGVIVQCKNLDSGGNPIFPLGYHFDYDDTTVSIT